MDPIHPPGSSVNPGMSELGPQGLNSSRISVLRGRNQSSEPTGARFQPGRPVIWLDWPGLRRPSPVLTLKAALDPPDL